MVLTLVERGGPARSASTWMASALPIWVRDHQGQNVSQRKRGCMTDELQSLQSNWSRTSPAMKALHTLKERICVAAMFHTNTVEGFYSVFKRGMKGVYQHCREKHLHRYLCEFDFRYSNRIALGVDDVARAERALKGGRSSVSV